MSASKVYGGSIAIVGGGISGLTLAIALVERGFNITVYEQAKHFGEIGAGVGFHRAAVQAMKVCSPAVYNAYSKVATGNQTASKADVYFDFFDATLQHAVTEEDILFTIRDEGGIRAVHRAAFLDLLVKEVPEGIAHFAKHLDTLDGPDGAGKYTLKFSDGTSAVHDAVIGTDGIKSSVRAWLVGGHDHPAANPVYTHKYAYRGLIPMERAAEGLGAEMACNAKCYVGPNGHVLTFPISGGEVMNVVAFYSDPGDWPDYKHLTRKSTKEQVLEDFKDFGTTVHAIIDMLEPNLDCWAIFDTGDHPLQRYNKGKVLVLGDAGHATSPHHGSGAGVCIEDAAVLAELLTDPLVAEHGERGIENAFEAFSAERIGRTRRLVESSRRAGEIYDGKTESGLDFKAMKNELWWRFSFFWEGDAITYAQSAKVWLKKLLDSDA